MAANQNTNPNHPKVYKVVISGLFEEEGEDYDYAVDLSTLQPSQVLHSSDSYYDLPEVTVVEIGQGWVKVRLQGAHYTLNVGESCSTGWYNHKPYWQACLVVALRYWGE